MQLGPEALLGAAQWMDLGAFAQLTMMLLLVVLLKALGTLTVRWKVSECFAAGPVLNEEMELVAKAVQLEKERLEAVKVAVVTPGRRDVRSPSCLVCLHCLSCQIYFGHFVHPLDHSDLDLVGLKKICGL